MARVWTHLGLPLNDEMMAFQTWDGDTLPILTSLTPLGYQLHLHGVEVYLKQLLGVAAESRAHAAAIMVKRQPLNPFFGYLNGDHSPQLVQQILDQCPKRGSRDGGRHNQWIWERESSEQVWRDSMGWDCLFLSGLPGLVF